MVLATGCVFFGFFVVVILAVFGAFETAAVFGVLGVELALAGFAVAELALALLATVLTTGGDKVMMLAAPGVAVKLQYQLPLASPQA